MLTTLRWALTLGWIQHWFLSPSSSLEDEMLPNEANILPWMMMYPSDPRMLLGWPCIFLMDITLFLELVDYDDDLWSLWIDDTLLDDDVMPWDCGITLPWPRVMTWGLLMMMYGQEEIWLEEAPLMLRRWLGVTLWPLLAPCLREIFTSGRWWHAWRAFYSHVG